ncbi:MAG: hypothetical protein K6A32_08785 [Bacteroidales bacterium]|nr:hypothetical protein [Bacteroidales bacterium]
MKTQKYIIPMAIAFAAGSALMFSACSDEWDDHYEGSLDTSADAPSLYEQVKADPDLTNLLRVVDHVGYNAVLSSPQTLTLWAPAITSDQADSIISLYEEQKRLLVTMPDGSQRNTKDKDNTAITQFMQNHLALFGHSVSSTYEDTIRMMNGKYMLLTNNSLNGIPFQEKNIVANNGIMYKLGSKEPFFPNVREAMSLESSLKSIASYYRQFDEYELDESSSVQMGVVDGEIVYADSVTNLTNRLYNTLGFVQREDSSYLFLAPSDEVWKRDSTKYHPYFNYINSMENRDSVAGLNASMGVLRGRLFNINLQHDDYQDSIFNTAYVNHTDYYGLNVFYNPKGAWNPETNEGILGGLTPQTCSNGILYIDNEGRIDPKLTFLQNRYILGSSMRSRTIPQLMVNSERQPQVALTTHSLTSEESIQLGDSTYDITLYKEILKDNFVEIAPISYQGVTNRNSSIYFTLPSTVSGMYYNVYVVMVPLYMALDGFTEDRIRPTRFHVYYNERLMTPRTSTSQTEPNEDPEFENPSKDRALTIPEGETHGSGTNFETTGDQVDLICIDKARLATVSGYNAFGSVSATQRYRLTTDIRASQLNNNTHTNVMYINRLIYIPFETEEEAKNFDLQLSDLSNLKEYKE